MIRWPAESTNGKTSTVFQHSSSLQALKAFSTPSQLWRGYTALAARNLPFTAMQFPMYERLKTGIKEYKKDKGTFTGTLGESALVTAASAGTAGSISALITTPVDVVKTRIMLAAAGESSEDEANKKIEKARQQGRSLKEIASNRGVTKKSSFTVARQIFQESGIKGLFRGGSLRAAWTALGSGLYLSVYESGRVLLGERRDNGQ